MSGFGSVSPVRATNETLVIKARYTSAGGADMTAIDGLHKGVASVVYSSSTGKFVVTLTDWPGELVDAGAVSPQAASSAPILGSPVWATLDKAAKTIPFEFWDLATPSLATPASGTNVVFTFEFKKTAL